MTVLQPMCQEAFASYLETAIEDYARDNIDSERWPKEKARELSRSAFRELLPQGLATADNLFFEIVESAAGRTFGYLWVAVESRHGMREAFVYDLKIDEAYRRQGHAQRAMLALESILGGLGLSRIGLHVFGHNQAAQALYRKLGYLVTDINMRKNIADSV